MLCRIGQLKPVTVYRLLTKNTYEQAMFRAASIKLGLDYAVMHNLNGQRAMDGIEADRSADHASKLSRKELENLLKHGAYGAFAADSEGAEDETIDQILSRSATVLHEEGADGSQRSSVKSSFSKASFVSAGSADAANTVSVDDPDFWQKVVGLAVREQEDALSSKRRCRDGVGSYKEPGLSVRPVTDDGSDSEGSEGGARAGKRAREAAEYSEAALSKLMHALLSKGYCNWAELARECLLRWTLPELVGRPSPRLADLADLAMS